MLTALLLLIAGIVLGREWILEHLRRFAESQALESIEPRHLIAVGLIVAAAISWANGGRSPDVAPPEPMPVPVGFSLAGKFVGPQAASDAAALSGLCDSLADCVEWDGVRRDGPRLTTGVAIDDLRIAAREGRLRGESIGERSPLVKQAIHDYLDRKDVLGPSGGPIDAEARAKWVAAFRTIARAAADAIK